MHFKYQQPNARTEAMGRGAATTYGDPSSVIYNPAASSLNDGFNIEASHLTPFLKYDNNNYYEFFCLSYNTKKYGALTFNAAHFALKHDITNTNIQVINNFYTSSFIPYSWLYTFNYSYAYSNYVLGFNLNYYKDHLYSGIFPNCYADLGLMKKIAIPSDFSRQTVLLGLSLTNISRAGVKENSIYYSIPSFFRTGISYEFQPNINISGFDLFKFLYSINYKNALNLDNTYSLQFGSEFAFLEILKLRVGYYWDKSSGSFTESQTDKHGSFTYGIGLSLPIGRLYNLSMPIELQFDYARLPNASIKYNINDGNLVLAQNHSCYTIYDINLKIGI